MVDSDKNFHPSLIFARRSQNSTWLGWQNHRKNLIKVEIFDRMNHASSLRKIISYAAKIVLLHCTSTQFFSWWLKAQPSLNTPAQVSLKGPSHLWEQLHVIKLTNTKQWRNFNIFALIMSIWNWKMFLNKISIYWTKLSYSFSGQCYKYLWGCNLPQLQISSLGTMPTLWNPCLHTAWKHARCMEL